ncbi:MAG: DUF4331 domain-containing protein [Actinomycetota bacterium]|nr:DUF4331 domain-containing protein [Actinomycetota bacterium]
MPITALVRTPKRLMIGGLAALLSLGLAASTLAPTSGEASSHREAPFTASEPQIDNTDVYAFTSPDAPQTVTLISNWIPFEEPAGGPIFYPFAEKTRYDIKISNDGDARAEIIYRWVFRNELDQPTSQFLYNDGPVTSLTDPNLLFRQRYNLKKIDLGGRRRQVTSLVRNAIAAPSDVGQASMPSYEDLRNQAIRATSDGGKTYAGQADDPFFLDLRVFDLLYGGDFSEVGDDTLRGFNTNTLALQVPKTEVVKGGNVTANNSVIGVWSTASRRSAKISDRETGAVSYRGRFAQVSRLGNPLVNEVVVPTGLKDFFNASRPTKDEQFLGAVNEPILPKVVEAVYGIEEPDSDPNKPDIQRDDLIAVFLTGIEGLTQPQNVEPSEMLRLNLSTPPCEEGSCADFSRLGVIGGDNAGFPNGRRLSDDVVDIALQVFEGELIGNPNDLGDAVNANEKAFENIFPYVGLPHRGSDPAPHDDTQQ